MLDRNATVEDRTCPARRDTDPRHLAPPARRFRDAWRSARLCGDGPSRPQFPRRPRHARSQAYPYTELREDALAHARRFVALGIKPGDRVALIAETGAEFAACFFGAVYAGAWPVPLPLPTSFGGREAYVEQLDGPADKQRPGAVPAIPPSSPNSRRGGRASAGIDAARLGNARDVEPAAAELPTPSPDDIAYLQYSSGSTRFPHGVAVTHRALLDNLRAHGVGLEVSDTDRVISWLPWYHDMGLVGCLLSPVAMQMSVDYLKTEDFARRPLAWLDLITRNPGTSVSYSPTFGYDICSRRMSSQTRAEDRFDLSRWRIAGNGADMIRPDVMQAFVDCFAARRLQGQRLLPELRPRRSDARGIADAAGRRHPARAGRGERAVGRRHAGPTSAPRRYRAIVNCGRPVDRHGGRNPRRRRRDPARPRHRQGLRPRRERHAQLFPRRGIDRAPASATTVGSTPATWAICRAATSSSSAAPRT